MQWSSSQSARLRLLHRCPKGVLNPALTCLVRQRGLWIARRRRRGGAGRERGNVDGRAGGGGHGRGGAPDPRRATRVGTAVRVEALGAVVSIRVRL